MPDKELAAIHSRLDLIYAMLVAVCDVVMTDEQVKLLSNELALIRAGLVKR